MVLRRGPKKGISRRCLERPLWESDPLGVHPVDCHRKKFTPNFGPPGLQVPDFFLFQID